ncbi:class I SAM-dependent methyltransferase [Actinoplanes sp. NPDC051633]|uniref:class I SAM-dependent methyltransferase n=1 Tax=Actinoplanes sp. NPDC051633 TaxID=3155670 RepID=UPI0034275443
MTRIFGEVAELYDDVRPGYPIEVLDAVVQFHGGHLRAAADLGAGTGKATELLVRLGVPVTCVEPDPRMAGVLAAKFPQVEVVNSTYEEWTPPAGGLDLVICALAWHWLDEKTRNARTRDALAPGGVLAVFAHKYGYADPAVDKAIGEVLTSVDPTVQQRAEHWLLEDVEGSGAWSEVDERIWHTYPEFSKERYLQLVQTFSPFRRHPPEQRQAALDGLDKVLDDTLTLDLTTTLVLARA